MAWSVIILADPPWAGDGSSPERSDSMLAHAGHHAGMHGELPVSHASTGSAAGFVIGWSLMLTAVMAPLMIPALRPVHTRSLRSRRRRAIGLVTIAQAATWALAGLAILALASALRSVTGSASVAVLLGLVAALGWQLSPLKQYCLNR